jgi:hypothetical protein
MTAIIAFFFFFFVPIPHQSGGNVPPACTAAVARYEVAAQRFNAENASRFEQVFGRSVGTGTIAPDECLRAMPFYRWRLPKVRALLRVFKTVYAACVGVSLSPRPPTPPQMVAAVEQKIAAGCR